MAPWSGAEEAGETTPLLKSNQSAETKAWTWSPAYTVAVLGCLGITVQYCQRVCLSIAIVAMTANKTLMGLSEEPIGQEGGELDWDATTQGLVLGSFFLGYAGSNLAGGYAADYFGGKTIFGLGIISSSLLSLLLPVCARSSGNLFGSIRLLQGLAQGVTFPAITALLASQTVPSERSRVTSIAYSGSQIGTVVGMVATGWLCSPNIMGGWPAVFYVFGVFGLFSGLLWGCFVHEEEPVGLSEGAEKTLGLEQGSVKIAEKADFPWKSIAKSLPFWALVAASVGSDFGFYTLLMELPKYLTGIRSFAFEGNAILSALPYLLSWFFNLVWASLVDFLSSKDKTSVLKTRKLSMAIASFGPMLGLIAMCFVNYDAILGMAVLCVSVMLTGAANSGYLCTHQDLSPNWAGSLLGITNTLGALAGVASPATSGLFTKEDGTTAWRELLMLTAAIYLITCIFYLVFASSDVQPWNESSQREETNLQRELLSPMRPTAT